MERKIFLSNPNEVNIAKMKSYYFSKMIKMLTKAQNFIVQWPRASCPKLCLFGMQII